jgi:urea transport system ATP-binding protein
VTAPTALALSGLDVFYGGSQVLSRVDLAVGNGEVVCVMGRNGVGKTTLLKTVMGLLAPRQGTIAFRGTTITHLPPYARARLGIGYVPQGRDIFPGLNVRENLLLGARRKQPPPAALEYVLSLFPALGEMLGKRGGDLSGGQQQQLAIARALVADPALLVLDEPTEGIQPSIVEEIADVLERIKREGRRSILLVEQYLEFARSICDRFYVMDKGGVALAGDRTTFNLEEVSAYLSV